MTIKEERLVYSLTSQSTSVSALPPSMPMPSTGPVLATTAAPELPSTLTLDAVPATSQPDQRQPMVASQVVQSGVPSVAAHPPPHPGAGQQVPGSQG